MLNLVLLVVTTHSVFGTCMLMTLTEGLVLRHTTNKVSIVKVSCSIALGCISFITLLGLGIFLLIGVVDSIVLQWSFVGVLIM